MMSGVRDGQVVSVVTSAHEILTKLGNGAQVVPVTLSKGERASIVRYTEDVLELPAPPLWRDGEPFVAHWAEPEAARVQTTVLVFDGGQGGAAALEAARDAALSLDPFARPSAQQRSGTKSR